MILPRGSMLAEGAGRKPTGRITRTVRVDPELWAWLGESAADAGGSTSDRLDAILRRARSRRGTARKRAAKKVAAKKVAAKIPPARPETGRNDPCPCGSGRKFKKCCLGKA